MRKNAAMTHETHADRPLTDWIGSKEQREDSLALAPVQRVLALLDEDPTSIAEGDPLPPLWQWFFFLPLAPHSELGPDGHPKRGGFLPPVPLPRRMFAGARMTFYDPLLIGRPATRTGTVLKVSEKQGGSGKLVFVTVEYAFHQGDRLCLTEEQDIVYREPGAEVPAPTIAPLPPAPVGAWTRLVAPDPRLLFRFSAVTFNAHRIHYDRPYAMSEEGYPGLVVHGPLTAVLLMELLRAHSGRPVTSFSFRGRAPLFDLGPFRVMAMREGDTIDLQAHGPDGTLAMTATAGLRQADH